MKRYRFTFVDGTKEITTGENMTDALFNIGCDHSTLGFLKKIETCPIYGPVVWESLQYKTRGANSGYLQIL